jgi:peptide/nickel transport system substrate-binding protein
MDPEQRKSYYDKWQLVYAKKLPVIFITKGMDLSAVQDDIGNYYVNDNGIIVGVNHTVFKK